MSHALAIQAANQNMESNPNESLPTNVGKFIQDAIVLCIAIALLPEDPVPKSKLYPYSFVAIAASALATWVLTQVIKRRKLSWIARQIATCLVHSTNRSLTQIPYSHMRSLVTELSDHVHPTRREQYFIARDAFLSMLNRLEATYSSYHQLSLQEAADLSSRIDSLLRIARS